MNLKHKILLSFLVCLLQACATISHDAKVDITLWPVHKATTGNGTNNGVRSRIIDNDGNLYETYWNVSSDAYAQFEKDVGGCGERLKATHLFSRPRPIFQYQHSQLTPSLYSVFIECIYSFGYQFEGKEGYKPNGFKLRLSLSRSYSSRFITPAKTFSVYKKGGVLADFYLDVKQCEAEAVEARTIREGVEAYVEKIDSCLTARDYTLEKS